MGEVFGLFRCPGCPRGVPGTPGAEKVTKSSSILRCFLVFWAHQNHTFSVFFDFCVVFWGMFFGSGFWRPPGTIFKGFGGGFRGVFSCFFEHVGQGSVLRKTSLCIVFQVFLEHRPFRNKLKIEKIRIVLCMFFWKVVGTSFLRIWGPFGFIL